MTGTDVKNARVMSGLRSADFAREIGVSLPTLADTERGLIKVPRALVLRIEAVVDNEMFKDGDPSPGEQESVDLDEIPSVERHIYAN